MFYLKGGIMQHEAILYSLDPTITRQQLQDQNQLIYDQTKYDCLQERIELEGVKAIFPTQHFTCTSIKSSPYILYYLGDITLLDKKILGVVGPRKMSAYGQKVIEELFAQMDGYDITTISGMADGVDHLCHSLSIQQGIPTIAVLGGGLGRYSKRPERSFIQQIVDAGGLVLSEFRLGDQPTHYTFPQRNRIIAGLSDILFLPEAGKKSGSLITVDFALASNIPVYATPNSIFSSTSEGILQLIESGNIHPLYDLKHFLHQHFSSKKISSRTPTPIHLTDEEQSIVGALSRDQGISILSLSSLSGNDIDHLLQLLTLLEIKGVVAQESPGEYVLV